jgi:hypothetical protein
MRVKRPFVDHLARHHDEVDTVARGPLEDGVENRGLRVEIGVGKLVPVDQHEIGGLADRDCADMAAIGCRRRPANRRHARDLARARDVLVIHPPNPVPAQHHAHLLQHVAVVVDPGFVEPIAVFTPRCSDW